MTDLRTLTDAFIELEHRADAVPLRAGEPASAGVAHPPRSQRAALVAASVVGVAAVAGSAVLLAGSGDGHRSTPAGDASTSGTTASSAPVRQPSSSASSGTQTFPKPSSPALTESGSAPKVPESSGAPASTGRAGGSSGPTALSKQLVALLGPSGALTLSYAGNDAGNPYIVGVLTVRGRRGGFDLQTLDSGRGAKASCDDPDISHCTVHSFADGSSLAVGSEPLMDKGGVTYQAEFVRADGRTAVMHASNERDPKGGSARLAKAPPLSTAQLAAIVESKKVLAIN